MNSKSKKATLVIRIRIYSEDLHSAKCIDYETYNVFYFLLCLLLKMVMAEWLGGWVKVISKCYLILKCKSVSVLNIDSLTRIDF